MEDATIIVLNTSGLLWSGFILGFGVAGGVGLSIFLGGILEKITSRMK